MRPRWRDAQGRIYEWDKRHGTVEVYDSTGKRHLGEYDPVSGRRVGPADPQRRGRVVKTVARDHLARGFVLQGFDRTTEILRGVNDSLDQIKPLAKLANRLKAKVNLIPYNKVEDLPWARPEEDVCEKFLAALNEQKVVATLRREKGHDIDAACGQLRLKTERELARAQ